ncbi:type I restriction-modification system subunit M [Photobacterium damselae]|uniref:type I restriction-modification system subunit M n=1 Tax=Photobacterium damselae TaxID=38293 RepID=UPI0010FD97F7|nr:type I restriction-modification system subunit M [Photobacterium damselae]TLS73908.1 type I restriction-modification system subunit M [Photobacterium damselae subsp. damselae]TLS89092.1 type I restriction-modification system subunit M [Photobacterium damselae subsp. damselae]
MANTKINQEEINQTVWSACNIFRGSIDPSIYKDFILTMLFLKYISDAHQEQVEDLTAEFGDDQAMIEAMLASQFFNIPAGATFRDLYDARNTAGNGTRIDKALHAIEKANGTKLKGVFQYISFNTDKLGDEKQKNDILCHLLEYFGKLALNLRSSRVGSLDVIGNAYEYVIKHFAANSGKSAGEFYTPPEVSDLLSIILEPQPGDEICDPACGSGSLLIKCGKQIQKNFGGSKQYALFGQEAIGSTWSLAKMNMLLHGEDNHRIEWGDTIRNPKLQDANGGLLHFDVVAANPPFSLDKWGHEDAEMDHFDRFHRGVPPKTRGDYAFISHMIETLKPETGRMGVVVPHGVLFRASSEGKIRQQLIEENLLDAVIGLPVKLFFGTSIPTAILIFKKKKDTKDVMFIDASREFKPGKNQNVLTSDNIQKIVDTYKARESVDKYAYLATLETIAENDYNLNIPRYVNTYEEEAEIDLMAVYTERLALQTKLADLEEKMAVYLKELGYGA